MTTTYDYSGHIQIVTVGTSGTYHITINGASGGHGGTGVLWRTRNLWRRSDR
jgi:hypothetical protein